MAYDRSQVPQPTANYPGHSHAAMYEQAMDGNDPSRAGEIAARWKTISSDLVDVAVGLNTVVNGLRAGWTGAAGAAASQALTKVGNFTDQLSMSFSATSGVINRQVETAETTKNKFPAEVPYNPQQILRDSAASLNPLKMAAAPFEMMAQREKSQAAKQEAERVMQERDDSLAAAAASMPTFDEAPRLPSADQGVTTTSSTTFEHTTRSVNPPAQLGNPGIGTPAVGNPGISAPGASAPGVSAPTVGSPGPTNGTTNTSWAAPPVTQPAAQGNNQQLSSSGNPNDRKPFTPGPGPIPSGFRPNPNDPRATGRGGGGPGVTARGGGGTGGHGFGAGSAAADRGSFGPSNPGGAAGVAHGPAGTARGATAAAAGRPGAAGAPGAGGTAAGAGNSEEDKEHRSNYLVPTDEYFDDDRIVAPPVIGD
ncbi:hypothetical protein [Lentzea sp. NPDC055074]